MYFLHQNGPFVLAKPALPGDGALAFKLFPYNDGKQVHRTKIGIINF